MPRGKNCFSKFILVFVNVLVILASVSLIVSVGYFLFHLHTFSTSATSDNALAVYLNLIQANKTYLYAGAGVLIAIAVFAILVALLGMCGACFGKPCFLMTYSSLMVLIGVVWVVALILIGVYWEDVEDLGTKLFKVKIDSYSKDISNTSETNIVDVIQEGLHCCGADSYKDFCDRMNVSYCFTNKVAYKNKYKVPQSCCAQPPSNSDDSQEQIHNCQTLKEHESGMPSNSSVLLYFETCPQALANYIPNVQPYIFGVSIVALLLIVMLVVLSCVFYSRIQADYHGSYHGA